MDLEPHASPGRTGAQADVDSASAERAYTTAPHSPKPDSKGGQSATTLVAVALSLMLAAAYPILDAINHRAPAPQIAAPQTVIVQPPVAPALRTSASSPLPAAVQEPAPQQVVLPPSATEISARDLDPAAGALSVAEMKPLNAAAPGTAPAQKPLNVSHLNGGGPKLQWSQPSGTQLLYAAAQPSQAGAAAGGGVNGVMSLLAPNISQAQIAPKAPAPTAGAAAQGQLNLHIREFAAEDHSTHEETVFSCIFNVRGDDFPVIGDSIDVVIDGTPGKVRFQPSTNYPGAIKAVVRVPTDGKAHQVVFLPTYDLGSAGQAVVKISEQSFDFFGFSGIESGTYESAVDRQTLDGLRSGAVLRLK